MRRQHRAGDSSIPHVACIVCTYNYGRFLPRCLDSLLAQRFPQDRFEVIVVDDGSTDETATVLHEYREHIRTIRQANRGLAGASNTGVLAARSPFFVRVDADDELRPDALANLVDGLTSAPSAAAAYPDRIEVDRDSGEKRVVSPPIDNIYQIIAPGVLFRTARVLEVGLYRSLYWEEYDLMLRLLRRYPIRHVNEAIYVYHLHGENMTESDQARLDGWRELIDQWGIHELRRWGSEDEMEEVFAGMKEVGPTETEQERQKTGENQ